MTRGHGGVAARQGGGEQRDNGADRPSGHIQDHVFQLSAAGGAAAVFLY